MNLALVSLALGGFGVCGPGPTFDATPSHRVQVIGVISDSTRVRLSIRGMTCGSCAKTAQLALEKTAGVYRAQVSYDSATAIVVYDPAKTAPERFIARLKKLAGYDAVVVPDAPPRPPEP